MNEEGDLLEEVVEGAVQVSGKDSDAKKEEAFIAFADGQIKALITKPKIGAMGLNFQNCHHATFFPSHSFEQYYQGVRRLYRFGQKHPVTIDIVTTEGEVNVLKNLQRKAAQADLMFSHLVEEMNRAVGVDREITINNKMEAPSWL